MTENELKNGQDNLSTLNSDEQMNSAFATDSTTVSIEDIERMNESDRANPKISPLMAQAAQRYFKRLERLQ